MGECASPLLFLAWPLLSPSLVLLSPSLVLLSPSLALLLPLYLLPTGRKVQDFLQKFPHLRLRQSGRQVLFDFPHPGQFLQIHLAVTSECLCVWQPIRRNWDWGVPHDYQMLSEGPGGKRKGADPKRRKAERTRGY